MTARWRCLGIATLFLGFARPLAAAEMSDAKKLYQSGKYPECIVICSQAIDDNALGVDWWIYKAQAELATGRNTDALRTISSAVDRYDSSLELRWQAYQTLLANDQPRIAEQVLASILAVAQENPTRYMDASSKVTLGRAMLRSGIDARKVLETCYDVAKKARPDLPDSYLATGDLSLLKHDYALAADAFKEAVKRDPDNPEAYIGLARGFDSNPEQAAAALTKAMELNPRYVEGMLFQADNLIDREQYPEAESLLKTALEINPADPRAWAYRAVLAQLAGQLKKAETYRGQALGGTSAGWKANPEVDYIIGLKLSQNYRFVEGSSHQLKALEFDSSYLPAKTQLCSDYLRLGKEDEGWTLADEVFKADKYNVLAYNLVTLHDIINRFKTLENEHFKVRMDPTEAQIYGTDVLTLLASARKKLCEKYAVTLPETVTVEIFAQQKDFAIRTFGLPGGGDYLGVCFGPVVTINSPASRIAHPANWQAILWHEFCHSVTLTKTRNKMPRWLSEGISVYEESQENPSWGQRMTPEYREFILAGKPTPVSGLSSAFLAPPTPMHLMFAYYESSKVIEYMNKQFGPDAVRRVLADLANDVPINEAIARQTVSILRFDRDFAAWLKKEAQGMAAPQTDWTRPEFRPDADSSTIAAWNKDHPGNYLGLLLQGRMLLEEHKWQEAKTSFQAAIALYPDDGDESGPYPMLAAAHRQLGETAEERAVLERYVARNAAAINGRQRLMELAAAAGDWHEVEWQAQQTLAINPLLPAPHRYLAQAAETVHDRPTAIAAYRALLLLAPLDRSEQHYRLAKLLFEENQLLAARREIDRSLEEAPRYRAAHALLRELAEKMETPSTAPAP